MNFKTQAIIDKTIHCSEYVWAVVVDQIL